MLPVIAAVGVVVVGGLAAYLYEDSKKKKPGMPVPLIQNQPGQPRIDPAPPKPNAPPPAPVQQPQASPAGNPIVTILPVSPQTGLPTALISVALSGSAKDDAHRLYDYIVAFGTEKKTPELKALTLAFQKAHNASPDSVAMGGKLEADGLYGPKTSAVLTVYTGNPIHPGIVNPPGVVTDKAKGVGSTAFSSSNLYAYLKQHKNDKSVVLKPLVKQFQHDVNTDPLYPGPANPVSSIRIIKEKLVEDGLYGPKSSDALAVITLERIPP